MYYAYNSRSFQYFITAVLKSTLWGRKYRVYFMAVMECAEELDPQLFQYLREFRCPVCGRGFKNRRSLLVHLARRKYEYGRFVLIMRYLFNTCTERVREVRGEVLRS